MIDILAPREQEGTKATVRAWLKKVGDTVALDEPLVELETDKVTQEVPAPAAGILTEILLTSDNEAAPGALLGRLRPAGQAAVEAAAASASVPATTSVAPAAVATAPTGGETRLSPSAKRAAKEFGIDPAGVKGSGHAGRVTRADIERAAAEQAARPAAPLAAPVAAPPAPVAASPAMTDTPSAGVRSHTVPHDSMRRRIAEHMSHSLSVAPHVTAVFEADFSAIMAHRRANKASFEKAGINLTFTAYFIAACVEAMKVAPSINSRWHDDHLEIFDDVNIGIGTALGDKGLVVPVVRGAQDLSLKGIASRLQDLTDRARGGRLNPADMRGGTFTISNHGVSGSLVATPIIINQPQSAILGIGKLEKRVVVREVGGVDTIQIRPMAFVSLTIDHRVVDGHQTNGWLSRFVEVLENWPQGNG
ncbi:dihydrolipoamide acetyltransferase family protein [Niveispirillum fermenti]|uniref:dihydrolipoamide acetyltransferase family protein n=1 Tax=Niveispirillum fermenti TaxID=1233113 RepID=UPI003A8AAA72